MNDLSPVALRDTITKAFESIYPDYADHTDGILVNLNDDETITVELEGITTWMAEIDSDDDGYLYFGLYDPDYEAEFPDEPRTDPVCLRVRYME